MKELVWVFGVSASGKETFIRSLPQDEDLRKKFGWLTKPIAFSSDSFANLGKLDKSRTSIIADVTALLEANDVVLIKWQYGDSLLHTPQKLASKYPELRHTAINLIAEENEQIRRLQTKVWWHDIEKESEFIATENNLVQKCLSELPRSFNIINLDTSKAV